MHRDAEDRGQRPGFLQLQRLASALDVLDRLLVPGKAALLHGRDQRALRDTPAFPVQPDILADLPGRWMLAKSWTNATLALAGTWC